MSRKYRADRRARRQQQQRRILMIGGGAVVVVIVVFLALVLYSADRDARRAADATATAEAIAATVSARQTEAAGGNVDPERPQPIIRSEDDMPQWNTPPEMTIDPTKQYQATFVTEKGDIVVELLADQAPITVNNFVFLAREGFYDNTTFHRVLPDFMAQGGDPTGTGGGGPGYRFEDETDNGLTFDGPGLLAMANAGPNTNGSQFFITYAAADWLNGAHTIFGRVVEGMDVAQSLTPRDPQTNPNYLGDTLITVTITESEG